MEIIMALVVIIVVFLLLGVSVSTIAAVIWWLMALLAALCDLFFFLSILFMLGSKNCPAKLLRLEKGKKMGMFAFYEIDGVAYKNLFPTDAILENVFYQKKEVKVRVRQCGKKIFVMDKVSLAVIAIGFPVFGLMTLVMTGLV